MKNDNILTRHFRSKVVKKVKQDFDIKLHWIFKLLYASALLVLVDRARYSTAHQLRRLSPPNGLIHLAVSDSSEVSQRLSDANTRSTTKRKRFLQLAGLRCPTILCEFLIIFKDFYFFRKISDTAFSGWIMERCCCSAALFGEVAVEVPQLEFGNWKVKNGAESANFRMFEILFKKKVILVFQRAYGGSAIYVGRSVYYFESVRCEIYRLDLDDNEELETVERIGGKPGTQWSFPVLFKTDINYCTWDNCTCNMRAIQMKWREETDSWTGLWPVLWPRSPV